MDPAGAHPVRTTTGVVDVHHHIWALDRTPWLAGPPVPRIFGDYPAIRRDYLLPEFAADAGPSGVTDSVYVQVNVAPGDEVAEVEWAAAQARAHGRAVSPGPSRQPVGQAVRARHLRAIVFG